MHPPIAIKPVSRPRNLPLAVRTASPMPIPISQPRISAKYRPTDCRKTMPTPISAPSPTATAIARAARLGFIRTSAERGCRAHSGHLIPTGL